MESIKQLPLNIQLIQQATFANFIIDEKNALINSLKAPADEQHWCIYLWGQAGRSHLLQAACHYANEKNQQTMYLPLRELQDFSPEILDNLEYYDLVALDDIDCVTMNAEWSEKLFMLYNQLHEKQHKLIITSQYPLAQLSCVLADLLSRLAAAEIFHIKPLSDTQKKQAFLERAQQLGFVINEEVSKFMLRYYSRDIRDLFSALEKLDRASMIHKRKLTIPFVKEILKIEN
jgi:DnaA family protein